MKKRIAVVLLLSCLLLILAGCGSDSDFDPYKSSIVLTDRSGRQYRFTAAFYSCIDGLHYLRLDGDDGNFIVVRFTCEPTGGNRATTYFESFYLNWNEGGKMETYSVNFRAEGHDLFSPISYYGGNILSDDYFWICDRAWFYFKASFKEMFMTVDVDIRVPR